MAAGLSAWGRWLFCACLAISWLDSLGNAFSSESLPYTRGIRLTPGAPGRRSWALGAATAAFAAALAGFAQRRAQAVCGLAALGLLAWLRREEISRWPGEEVVRLGKYFPSAACLAGYLAAYLACAARPAAYREAAGWEAACGVLAGAYAISAWMKWKEAGREWFSSANMGLLIAERAHDKPAWLAPARLFVASSPRLCVALAAAGLGLEALALGFVAPPLRWPFAAASALFQALIAVFLGYVELEWILIVAVLALLTVPGGA